MKSSFLLPWCRSWSRRVPILHGILIAQMILMPFPPSSQAVWVPVDADGDGVFETSYDDSTPEPQAPPSEPPPTDDSDGDQLTNAEEAAAGSNPYNPDSDYDGITDADEVNLTGTDPTSTDSNGNGVSDYNEFYGNYTVDTDVSGPGESPYDHDGDGIADPVDPDPLSPQNDPDSDGDYVPDSQDTDPYSPTVWNDQNDNGINDDAEAPNTDIDGDGVSNESDSHPADFNLSNDWNYNGTNDQYEDWDGDGVTNLQDSHPNSNVLWCDWNGNGLNDDSEGGTADSDGDTHADNSDSHPFNNSLWEDWNSNGTNDSQETNNADGDPAPDFQDSHPNDSNLWEDWNGNGTNDSQEPPPDLDRDDDGYDDVNDSDPDNNTLWNDWNRNGMNDDQEPPPMDSDGDGHPDPSDSDPSLTNLWEDWNRNGYNDSNEDQFLDNDGDGTTNAHDTHPNDNALWNDHNGNSINDQDEILVTDRDGDGYNDDLDTHPDDINLWNDHNGNGTNDELELPPDGDQDGIPDGEDEFPGDHDNDGLTDQEEIAGGTSPTNQDTDGDGSPDGIEQLTGTNPTNVDTDSDGLTDTEEQQAYHTDPLVFTETIAAGGDPVPEESAAQPNVMTGNESPQVIQQPMLPAAPEIEIELSLPGIMPSGNLIADGAMASFPSLSLKADKSDQKRTLTIYNRGTAALTGLAVTLDGTNRALYTFSPLMVTSLAPGASTALTITFKGAIAAKAELHIASNDADEPIFDIQLRSVAGIWSANKAYFFADLSDGDSDGIPDRVEEMYNLQINQMNPWQEITPDGDLDGDGVNNLDEYLNGTDLRDNKNTLDLDGDGVTNLVEETWSICMNKFRYSDAFIDADGDGLLNIEELNGSHGTAAKIKGLVVTSPIHVSSGPTSNLPTSNYNVASRRRPYGKAGESPFGGWYNRNSSYAPWMTDGTLRHASLEKKLPEASPAQITAFFTPELVFPPATNVRYKTKIGITSPALVWGYDHVPKGYLMWLDTKKDTQGNPLQRPPLGGANELPSLPFPPIPPIAWPFVSRTPPTQGVLAFLSEYTAPASNDLDNDGMYNAWEACYEFNFRDASDGDIVITLPANATVEQTAAAQAALARMKDGSLIREYPLTYTSGGHFTEAEWKAMNRVDPDHDGLPNKLECEYDHDPRIPDWADTKNRDSDGDGFSNGEELLAGTNYLSAQSHPAFTLEIVSANETNNQKAPAMSVLTKPLIVRVKYDGTKDGVANPTPRAGMPLDFACATVAGTQFADALSEQVSVMKDGPIRVVTDAQGLASVHVQMPPAPGKVLSITATYPANTARKVTFKATVLSPLVTGAPELKIMGGGAQEGTAGRRLPQALSMVVQKPWKIHLPSGKIIDGYDAAGGVPVTLEGPAGGVFVTKTSTHSGSITLNSSADTGTVIVRYIAPNTTGRIVIRARLSNGHTIAFLALLKPAPPVGGSGDGGTLNPDEPNPAFYLSWQTSEVGAEITGLIKSKGAHHSGSITESRKKPSSGQIVYHLKEGEHGHYIPHGVDGDTFIAYRTYIPHCGWTPESLSVGGWRPKTWEPQLGLSAPTEAEARLPEFPDFDTMPEFSASSLWLGYSQLTRIDVTIPPGVNETRTPEQEAEAKAISMASFEKRVRARLVARDTETGAIVRLPQGTEATYLPIAKIKAPNGDVIETKVLAPITVTIPKGASVSEPVTADDLDDSPFPAAENTQVDVNLPRVELLQPKLEADGIMASGDPVVTTAPRFARWRNGFTEPGGQFKQDWIKNDQDRVIVRIPGDVIDPALPWVNVKVKNITGVSGRTIDDDYGFLELTSKNGGFESEPFLFVADEIDDTKYNGDQGQDNNMHDQTRLASFGAEISIKVQLKGQSTGTEISMGKMYKPENTVKVELNVLQGSVAVTAADKAKAQQHFDEAKLLYRQIGVDLVQQGAVNVVALPAGYASFIAQQNGGYIYDTTPVDWRNSNPTGEKFDDYLKRISAGTQALKVYYIKADLQAVVLSGDALGWGIVGGDYCINELFQDSPRGAYLTAHEIGHVLGADHPQGQYPHQIMRDTLPQPNGDHKDPRRFSDTNERDIGVGNPKFYK